jgi:3-hydroxymyristoyl/3-hydroxydecanoyl-(acyl carrier protein) dehydratase
MANTTIAKEETLVDFRSFSFVDRITSMRNATHICGRYAIPSDVDEFPGALVSEAVAQLAAWAAMSALKFTHRPIAGLAGCIEFPAGAPLSTRFALREPNSSARSWSTALRPHSVLELAANLEWVDTESVVYSGTAHTNGRLVVRLLDCLGPMVPTADLDDPQALANRFIVLCGSGAVPGGFRGLPPLALERTAGETGRQARATYQVPPSAPFFADHFPRRPVFPGSLLMHLSLQLGDMLVSELQLPANGRWGDWTILDMKLRSFIPPGTLLELDARLQPRCGTSAMLAVKVCTGTDLLATAQLVLKPELNS